MPSMTSTSSVAFLSASKNPGVNMLPSRATSEISTRLAPPNYNRCFTKVCMYSCLSGSCLVNEASMRRPRAPMVASAAVTSTNSTTMTSRCPKMSFSSASAVFESGRDVPPPAILATRIELEVTHAALARADHLACGTGQQGRNTLAIVLLRQPEGLAGIARHQQHAGESADHHAQVVDGDAVREHGGGVRLELRPGLATVRRAIQVATQPERQ